MSEVFTNNHIQVSHLIEQQLKGATQIAVIHTTTRCACRPLKEVAFLFPDCSVTLISHVNHYDGAIRKHLYFEHFKSLEAICTQKGNLVVKGWHNLNEVIKSYQSLN